MQARIHVEIPDDLDDFVNLMVPGRYGTKAEFIRSLLREAKRDFEDRNSDKPDWTSEYRTSRGLPARDPLESA